MNVMLKCASSIALLITLCAAGAGAADYSVKITAGGAEMYATFEDNAATRELLKRFPMTVHMEDLYDREMCYHLGAGALPTEKTRSDGYEVGDIIYWPPLGSLVILYAQNGERFSRQQLGHIESGVEVFERTGATDVKFELTEGKK